MIATVVLLQACSAKKNTAGSRFWQALNTRYNVYYHGKTNYDEQIKILEDEYQDDYSQRLFVHPAEARANPKAPQPGGSFDRTIEKMQKAIALHSIKKKPKRKAGKGNDPKFKEWMKREEYNPFLHNAWYMLAKGEYMKGDFLNAAATFRYISRHFTWKQDLALEAQVWEALCYCALGWTNEADNVLDHIHIDKIENKRIRSLANLAFADYYIKEKRNEQAIPHLEQALDGTKGSQKVRLNFLLGQLYEDSGNNTMAYKAYKRAGSSNSSSYRTKFNARIKQSAVYNGSNVTGEVKALRSMARFDRNKEYLDQIYYAIGNLYLSRDDTVHAVENYIKAAEKSTRNGVDKAISQLTLGGIYFAQHKYDKAQPCYAEAIPLINEDYPNYKMLKHRSDVLDELAVYSQNVTLQDSLLDLAKLPLEEQKKVIKKIIDELKKKEKEEAENAAREEYMAQQGAQGNPLGNKGNQPTAFQMNNDKSWYFYNTATKNAGKTSFQQSWGNRKLEDNWRRRNKTTFSLGDDSDSDNTAAADTTAAPGDTTAVDQAALKRAEDPHYEEYYLKQIPKTEEQIKEANDIIVEGLYNMGVILKDKLEDPDAAEFQFNELMRRYPDNTHRLDTYYNLYLMYMRYGQTANAEQCRDTILSEFAESNYGLAMKDPNYLDNLKNMETDQEEMYAQAYADYLANRNESVHAAYDEMMKKYPLSKIMPKFMFIDALSYITQKDYDKFQEVLKEMLQRYPETDITPVASGIVKQLNAGRKLTGGSANTRGMLWSTRLGNDSTGSGAGREVTPFKPDLDKPHLFVLPYDVDSVNANMLLYEVARHNFNAFVVKDYDLEQLTFGRLGLMMVKGFANYDEVVHYKTVFEEDKDMELPDSLQRVLISESNFQLLIDEGRSFEEYFNWLDSINDVIVEGKVPELKEAKAAQNAQVQEKTTTQAPQAAATQAPQAAIDTTAMTKHVVKRGDKLSKIADTYGVTVDELRAVNNLPDNKIKMGQTLWVPATKDSKLNAEQAKKDERERKRAEARERKRLQDEKRLEETRKREQEKKREQEEAELKAIENEKANSSSPVADEKEVNKDNTPQEGVAQPEEKTQSVDTDLGKTSDILGKSVSRDQLRRNMQQSRDEKKQKTNDEKNDDKRSVKDVKRDNPQRTKEDAKAEAERRKAQEIERKRAEAELKKQEKALAKEEAQAKKEAEERLKADIKQKDREAKAREKEEMKRLKEKEKAEKARRKQLEKLEKKRQDSIARAEKEADKILAKLQKAREDSIARVEKAREDSIARADQERLDARAQKEKDKYQAAKDAAQAKIDAKKQQEKERKERLKAREQERKQKAKERKQQQKEREKARKEREKQRKAEMKEKQRLQKEKQKQREAERKQKAKEREAERKQKNKK